MDIGIHIISHFLIDSEDYSLAPHYKLFCSGYFAGSCEPGSRCHPNECIFGSGKPQRVEILGRGVYEQGERNGELVYEQPGNEVDGSYHSKEGSK